MIVAATEMGHEIMVWSIEQRQMGLVSEWTRKQRTVYRLTRLMKMHKRTTQYMKYIDLNLSLFQQGVQI